MTRQNIIRSILGFTAVMMIGCTTENRILTALPGPYHLDYCEAPSPVVPTEVVAVPEVKRSAVRATTAPSHVWMPATGISDRWTCIVIHHSDSGLGSLDDIDTWHHQQGWEHGCGYHFVIGNGTHSGDGQVEVSHRWHRQIHGAHTRLSDSYARRCGVHFQHYNEHGIGIVLVGDFDESRPSMRQLDALVRVLAFLTSHCGIPVEGIHTHGEVDQTHCPGRLLDIDAIRARIRSGESLSGGQEPSGPQTGT